MARGNEGARLLSATKSCFKADGTIGGRRRARSASESRKMDVPEAGIRRPCDPLRCLNISRSHRRASRWRRRSPRVRPREREFLRAADRGSLHRIYTRYVALHERRVALTGETSERTDDQSRTLESTDRSAD